jgi:hypothetical protein
MKLLTRLIASSVLLSISALSLAADESTPMTGQMPMAGQMQQKMQQHIKEADTNGDGNISKQEFMAGCEKRFQKMDANGDGQITKEERQQMRSQMMQHKGQMGGQTGTP